MDWTFEDYDTGDLSYGREDFLETLKDNYSVGEQIPKEEPTPDPQPKEEFLILELHASEQVLETVEIGRHLEAIIGVGVVADSFEFDTGEEDKLGNHEIQRLMQQMTSAETREANVRDKTDNTANAIIGKI